MEITDIRKELGLENIDFGDIDRIKLQLQNINDTIKGGIRSANLKEYRNTYVINARENLDNFSPMYVYFNILDEMIKIVSVKVYFWILDYQSYSEHGISEEKNSPTIKFYVSEDGGTSYSGVFGGYISDRSGIYITPYLTKKGNKLIKFTSNIRARLIVQIEVKLDIRART